MRGKNILWLSLIAMFISTMMVTVATGQSECMIYVDPSEIHNEDLGLTDGFTVDIKVQSIEDLYAYAFKLKFAPYARTLVVASVTEGDFLKGEGISTSFIYEIDPFHGEISIGNARMGVVPGASGDGTLATIEFTVMEAGESTLDITHEVLIDSELNYITCEVVNGHYYGPVVEFADIDFSTGRAISVRKYDSVTIGTNFTNIGEVPLQVRVRYDIVGEGVWNTFYGGQSFVTTPREPEYLYINEYNPFYEWDWTNPGASVIGEPDGNYAESIIADAMSSTYGFEDITLYPGDLIGKVSLEGYCQYPNGPTEAADIDIYAIEPAMFAWLGSLYGSTEWGWVSPRWIGADVSDELPELLGDDPSALNSLSVLLYNYEGSAADPMRVDALRVKVEFAQYNPINPAIYELEPGESAVAEATWGLTLDDIGRYQCKSTVEFTYNGISWIPAEVKEFALKVFWPGKAPPK